MDKPKTPPDSRAARPGQKRGPEPMPVSAVQSQSSRLEPRYKKLPPVADWAKYTLKPNDEALVREMEGLPEGALPRFVAGADEADLAHLIALVKKARGELSPLSRALRQLVEERSGATKIGGPVGRPAAKPAAAPVRTPQVMAQEGSGTLTGADVVRANVERQLGSTVERGRAQLKSLLEEEPARAWLGRFSAGCQKGELPAVSACLKEVGVTSGAGDLVPLGRELLLLARTDEATAAGGPALKSVWARGVLHALSPREPKCLPNVVLLGSGPRPRLAFLLGAATGFGLEPPQKKRLAAHLSVVLSVLVEALG